MHAPCAEDSFAGKVALLTGGAGLAERLVGDTVILSEARDLAMGDSAAKILRSRSE
jgi:hypothetical protein